MIKGAGYIVDVIFRLYVSPLEEELIDVYKDMKKMFKYKIFGFFLCLIIVYGKKYHIFKFKADLRVHIMIFLKTQYSFIN